MKLKYRLSTLALEDIDSIWEYTVEKWSIKQAEKYYQLIIAAIHSICKHPKIGRAIPEVNNKHRTLIVGSHMIIYKIENDLILIDRILHQRMDIDNELLE